MQTPRVDIDQNPERNRALDTRRDNDTFITPSITIYDIDYAIYFYLKEKIQPQITQNDVVMNVPILFANGEKWAQIQRYGFIRDPKKRTIMVPLISIKRTGMADDDRFMTLNVPKIDSANSMIYFPVTQKNNQFDLPRSNNQQSYEFYVSPIPQRIRVNYELMVWAETVDHLNKIVESISSNSRLPWGDAFQFVTAIEDYTFDVTNNVGEDRVAKCTINLVVDGMLQNEFDLKESTVQKAYTTKRVVFKNEVEQDNIIVDYEPRIVKPSEERLSKRKLENKL